VRPYQSAARQTGPLTRALETAAWPFAIMSGRRIILGRKLSALLHQARQGDCKRPFPPRILDIHLRDAGHLTLRQCKQGHGYRIPKKPASRGQALIVACDA